MEGLILGMVLRLDGLLHCVSHWSSVRNSLMAGTSVYMPVFVICGFIKNFLPNSYFILQIYHPKSYEMRYVMSRLIWLQEWGIKIFAKEGTL